MPELGEVGLLGGVDLFARFEPRIDYTFFHGRIIDNHAFLRLGIGAGHDPADGLEHLVDVFERY